MDLSALSALSKSTQNTQHLDARHKKADKLYRLGTEFLKRAQKEHYRNRSQLKNAVKCLTTAIENNRKDPRPYLKVAYIYLLLNNPKKATQYITEGLRLDPQNSEGQKLQQTIQNRAKKSIKASRNQGTGPLSEPQRIQSSQNKGQKLYAELQHQIQQQVQTSYQQVTGIKPTLIPLNLKKLKELFKQYEANYEAIASKLDQLEEEGLDISRLDQELRKFEINLNLLEDTCKLSEEQMAVKNRIVALKEEIDNHLLTLVKDSSADRLQALEAQLPGYIDQCDSLADDLEMFEGSGYDIQPLMKFYDQLIANFERFENTLAQKKGQLS